MLIELGCLAGGIIPGRVMRHNAAALKMTGKLTMLTIYALLFIMGAGMGVDNTLSSSLDSLGLRAVITGLFCTMGSVLCTLPLQRLFPDHSVNNEKKARRLRGGLGGALLILGFFCLGLVLAHFGLLPGLVTGGGISAYALRLMLVCVGMGIGFDLSSLMLIRAMGIRVAMLPLCGMAGAAFGAVVSCLLLPMELRETLAVSAGFGYYSLSSAIINDRGYAALGTIALISNMTREFFTLLAAPFLTRLFGPIAPVAAAGATGMDTCLPVIVHFTGEKYGIISIFNGLVLTMLAPILVPLIMLFFE